MRVLGLETSCDETAAAVVEVDGAAGERPRGRILSDVVHTQAALHAKYGGVVPELASRDHLQRALGHTLDDAAGEAFDKVAKLLGLPYPGGAHIDRLAKGGDPRAIEFPRGLSARPRDEVDFSFSGLKTAVLQHVRERGGVPQGQELKDLCASFQEAVCDALTLRAMRAARTARLPALVVCGGVAANSRLRALAAERAGAEGIALHLPSPRLCTDNGALIAMAGAQRLARGERAPARLAADPGWRL